jgi:hypothetical protein
VSQYGPGDPPPSVVRAARRRKRKDRARAQRNARAQEAGYVSQGKAVEHAARQQRPPAYKPPQNDTKSDADRGRAEQHKSTSSYRGAVKAGYKSRPLAERKRRVARAQANIRAGRGTVEDRTILHEHESNVARNAELKTGQAGHDVVRDQDLAAVEQFKQTRHYQDALRDAHIAHAGVENFSRLGELGQGGYGRPTINPADVPNAPAAVARTMQNIGIATSEDPVHVLGHTVLSAPKMVAGIPAGVVEGTLHPVKSWNAFWDDLEQRYGESDAAQQKRFKQHGILPELLDATSVTPAAGAAGGRAAGKLGELGALGKTAKALMTEPRPHLRTGGGEARAQELSPNLFKASVQRAHDTARQHKTERLVAKGVEHERPVAPERAITTATNADAGAVLEVNPLAGKGRRAALGWLTGRDSPAREVAARKSRAVHERAAEVEQHARTVREGLAKLTKRERKAFYYVASGTVPADAAKAVPFLEHRLAAIRRERKARGTQLTGLHKLADETRAIREFLDAPGDYFTPRVGQLVRDLHRDDVAVAAGDPRFAADTKLLRRHAQQADVLELERATGGGATAEQIAADKAFLAKLPEGMRATALRGHVDALDELGRGEETAGEFARRVRAAADKAGLERPIYFPSQRHALVLDPQFGDYAVGGSRAMSRGKQYTGRNFAEGRQDTNPEVYIQGLARSIKAKHNWQLVSDTLEDQAYPGLRNMTVNELNEAVHAIGADKQKVRYWNPGVFRRELETHGIDPDHLDADEFESATVQDALEAATNPRGDESTGGWSAIPREAFDEVMAGTRPSGAAGRTYDIVKGKASRWILGSNPSWLAFQVAANTFTGALQMGHRLPSALIKQAVWYRRLSEADRTAVDAIIGAQGMSDLKTPRIGAAANSDLVRAYQGFKALPIWGKRLGARGPRVRDFNPIEGLLQLDRLQTNQFRRAAFMDSVEGAALRKIGDEMGKAHELQGRITRILRLPPEDAARAILDDPALMEQHARHVSEWMGEWSTYTATERRQLARIPMFYGFMRYSLRLAFYTLPVKHPIIGAIMGQLGQLHEDELEALGLGDYAGSAGKIYNNDGTEAVDLSRLNPFMNQIVGLQHPTQLLSVAPPIAWGLEQATGMNLYTGKRYLTEGNPGSRYEDFDVAHHLPERGRILADDVLSLFAPYRTAKKIATDDAPQGDDSLAWDPRPVEYSNRTAMGRRINRSIDDKIAAYRAEPTTDKLIAAVLPLLPQKVDDKAIAASLADQRKHHARTRRKHAAKAFGARGSAFGSNASGFGAK